MSRAARHESQALTVEQRFRRPPGAARRQVISLLVLLSLFLPAWAFAQAVAPFDRRAWLDDLAQVRAAVSAKYAGLEWEVFERHTDLSQLFAESAKRIAQANSDPEARRVFDRLVDQFGDRHVLVRWPAATSRSDTAPPAIGCDALGYAAEMQAAPLATMLPGFTPVQLPSGNVFPAGVVVRASRRIGIIKIPLFMARGFPSLCERAFDDLHLDRAGGCDSDCQDRVAVRADDILTLQLQSAIDAVKAAGASVLIIDLAGNTGGPSGRVRLREW